MSNPIIAFLQRDGALETWRYERRFILSVEVLCLLASVVAAPTPQAAAVQMLTAPIALWAAELARADRSAAARRAERSAFFQLPPIELACDQAIERAAKNRQLVTLAWPLVTLAMSLAAVVPSAASLRAIGAGFVTSCIRLALVECYGTWRRWYRQRSGVGPRGYAPTPAVIIGAIAHRILDAAVAAGADRADATAALSEAIRAALIQTRHGSTVADLLLDPKSDDQQIATRLCRSAVKATEAWLIAEGWPTDLEDPRKAAERALTQIYVDCPGCGAGGFSKAGTSYGDVCSTCGGQSANWYPTLHGSGKVS